MLQLLILRTFLTALLICYYKRGREQTHAVSFEHTKGHLVEMCRDEEVKGKLFLKLPLVNKT